MDQTRVFRRTFQLAIAASILTVAIGTLPLAFILIARGQLPLPFLVVQSLFTTAGSWQGAAILTAATALWPACVLMRRRLLVTVGRIIGMLLVMWGAAMVLLAFAPTAPEVWHAGPPMMATGLLGTIACGRLRRELQLAEQATGSAVEARRPRWRRRVAVLGLTGVTLVAAAVAVLARGPIWNRPPVLTAAQAQPGSMSRQSTELAGTSADQVREAVRQGRIVYKLTQPDELLGMLDGPVVRQESRHSERQFLNLQSGSVAAQFQRTDPLAAFTLSMLWIDGRPVDIGMRRQIVLRGLDDLKAIDPFWGVRGMSLAKLDLLSQEDLLRRMAFDTRTIWPEADRMPKSFDPARVLEEAKDPGLGILALHQQGIDGRGVHIAIIDQTLLRSHQEYAGRLVRYEDMALDLLGPQMHGPAVASIAIGKTCGVAPEARLTFFGYAGVLDNRPLAYCLDRIIDFNRRAEPADRIRVVSISSGMFPHQAYYPQWQESLARATENGVLVITCDPNLLRYGCLTRIPGRDVNDPHSYRLGRYVHDDPCVLVPANRTVASEAAPDAYTYWAEGGMSWVAPYLAGLAALGYQVNSDLQPKQVLDLLVQTATPTDIGPVINPAGFIEAARGGRRNNADLESH